MTASQGLVVAPQAEAAWEAARVLDEGGNAADALVTGALVQGVVDPHRCGIGGFGCATVRFPGRGSPLAIDFHARAGAGCRPDMWIDRFESVAADGFGYVLRDKVNDVGYGAIAVPGMLAGLGEIHARFGTMPWRELVLRAVRYAEEGFVVGPDLAAYWTRPGAHGRAATRERLGLTAEARRLFLHADGTTLAEGETLRQPDLARTYRRLAEEGADGFFRGSLAEVIARNWEEHGAGVTRGDLASYRPTIAPPVEGSYRRLRILTTPLPGGGVALLQALGLLERHDLGALTHGSPELIDRIARVLHAVSRDRLANHADPAAGGPGAPELLARAHLDSLGEGPLHEGGADSPCTTQLSIVDRWENAVSFSHSLGFNSGVVTPGLGFMHNNAMSAFDPRPGRPGSIGAGRARTTAVAETLVLDGERLKLVLGSPGAARITAALVQTLVLVVDFGMSIAEAVVHPRFFPFADGDLELESRFAPAVVGDLKKLGWRVRRSTKPFGQVGRVYAIEIDRRGGAARLHAGVDAGEPGAAFRTNARHASERSAG
jgi:gamma-glutamyltranspeptidase/glutathione hydrolase